MHTVISDDTVYEPGAEDYTLKAGIVGAAFLMLKHGYRWEIGQGPGSAGAGLELGLGAMAGGGSIDFADKDGRGVNYGAEVISPVFELGTEFTWRTKDNLRLVSRLAVAASLPLVDGRLEDIPLKMEAAPVCITLRLGFVRDYARDY
ncbi:MAG: hypothetical protein RBT62_06865 [Spirochaetia bacterium]|nr:hypothetical protein [Spirochaetia bacterium]